ncbi:MAG TPA: AAA-like domain-containing protein [Nostoc sp.]|uniref:AAA-like domain-containing protein n=1 Tax=Nostoc sp. TaxID=1180 RepID=UPI002D4D1578|nr:AAA-like domain-containing protein [Nostoc sp.]HYX13274.1 AAA-like domain-containing protein [Nostoc sp.]
MHEQNSTLITIRSDVYDGLRLRITFKTVSTKIAIALLMAFYYLQQQTVTLEELLENSAFTTTIYAEHLEQQWWNLQGYPDLVPSFTEIVKQSNFVYCEAVQASQLYNMGLVHLHGEMSSLACKLFRPFFGDRLLQINS